MIESQEFQEPLVNTEQRILDAAKLLFVQKGMDGTKMQDIADSAKISRTSLHYYFRSKQKLFEAVFYDQFDRFLPRVTKIMEQEITFEARLGQFVDKYLDLFLANPYLPNFMMNELNRDPEKMIELFAGEGLFSKRVREQVEGELRLMNPSLEASHFILNLISLCVFPFIARPMVKAFLINGEKDAFSHFIRERRAIIVDTLMCSINDAK
ncbi:TetR family transcriptional regulator [Desulfoluna sp.]|uniref:TetR/AcrR family transcriptional regulator n=1 Tax=Desulfoluna sp. TaxID=2045199 RepID=UPI00263179A0|nr:TetR family transcriptional regulator [Desulfoluna sp.]